MRARRSHHNSLTLHFALCTLLSDLPNSASPRCGVVWFADSVAYDIDTAVFTLRVLSLSVLLATSGFAVPEEMRARRILSTISFALVTRKSSFTLNLPLAILPLNATIVAPRMCFFSVLSLPSPILLWYYSAASLALLPLPPRT